MMNPYSKIFFQPTYKHGIFIILVLSLFLSGCTTKFERSELIEGTYYPNGSVRLEGRPVASLTQNYYLTISQPIRVTELGLFTKSFFNQEPIREYEYAHGGSKSFEAAKAEIPGLGEYYIPVIMLKNTGRFEYHERTLTFIEWIQDNPIWTIFLFLILLVAVIIFVRYTQNQQKRLDLQKQREAEEQQLRESREEQINLMLKSLLAKSEEIVKQILPYYEASATRCIEKAKIEFSGNFYTRFWSEIEEATKFLAYYEEALNQLCLNSEIYTCTLENKSHNFPIPFPFATNISISQMLMDEYESTIRKAEPITTFAIIWEQRRNSEILISRFRTLEHAVNNMSDTIHSAIYDLENSIRSELSEMRYVQKEQLRSFETSQVYLNQTLSSMDNKLYYIQWNTRPKGTFHHL